MSPVGSHRVVGGGLQHRLTNEFSNYRAMSAPHELLEDIA